MTGKQTVNEFDFFYDGWKIEETNPNYSRQHINTYNFFPAIWSSQLDGPLLNKIGLKNKRMNSEDAFSSAQLVILICDPTKSGIKGDPWKPYYTKVALYTNSYANDVKGWNGAYSREFRTTVPEEHINWDGIIGRNSNNNDADIWNPKNENQVDPLVAKTVGLSLLFYIKATKKICRHYDEKKKGEKGYDPTQKYRLIWDVTCDNVNQLLGRSGLDISVDKTTWSNALYADMQGRLRGKKESKGGQHTIVVDARSWYMYDWTPWHKGFPKVSPFTQEGPMEVKRIVGILNPLVIGEKQDEGDKRRQIFQRSHALAWITTSVENMSTHSLERMDTIPFILPRMATWEKTSSSTTPTRRELRLVRDQRRQGLNA